MFGRKKQIQGYRLDPYLRSKVLKRDNYKCRYCGSTYRLHVDHIKPRSKGGKDTMRNLVTACQRCNLSKGARTLPGLTRKAKVKKYSKERKKYAKKNPIVVNHVSGKPKRRWWLMWLK